MEHSEETRYTIGQMAKICNMTTKQLRFYDENNILKPIYKDQKTGYRYYNQKQIEEVLFLKELKRINFSLSEISEAWISGNCLVSRRIWTVSSMCLLHRCRSFPNVICARSSSTAGSPMRSC